MLAVVLVGVGSFVFMASQPSVPKTLAAVAMAGDPNLTAVGSATSTVPAGMFGNSDEATLANDIQQIDSINLDTSILQSPAFLSFTNFVQVIPQSVGRVDPFAPISGLTVTSSSSAGH